MTVKRTFLGVIFLLVVAAVSAPAQSSLGELVAQGGYDWFLGKWIATTDEGDELVFEQRWILDRHAVAVEFQMRDFRMSALMILVPGREEVLQFGADSRGGTWKGTWRDEYGSAVQRMEHTRADGEVQKAEIVHTRVDADTMKVVMYGLDSYGDRNAEPWSTLTYRRQTGSSTAGQDDSSAAPGTLGDLLVQNGYEWVLGKWQGTDDQDRLNSVTYALIPGKYAGSVDVEMGSFAYHGLVMFVPASEEVIQIGADNMGGFWKGTWTEDYDGLVNRHEYTQADGSTGQMEHVYVKVNDTTMKIKQYAVEADGRRAATPRAELVLNRPTGAAASK